MSLEQYFAEKVLQIPRLRTPTFLELVNLFIVVNAVDSEAGQSSLDKIVTMDAGIQ